MEPETAVSKVPGLHLAQNLDLPLEAVTRKIAILGMSGSGKTYCAGKLAEEMLVARQQIIIIDTVGNWYGLRLAADGKQPGIAIPVFGGDRGDIPLEPASGELVAELVAHRKFSVVLDVSDFTEGEKRRFVTAFARRLLVEKKRSPGPMMVLWEECHECIPQRVDAADAPMVGAVERLVKRGRNYGVGTTLVSQQPQAVNKAVLNQAQLLLAFQTSGKHKRKAIEDWVDANQADRGPLDGLATMPQGTAVVWSPAWLKTLTTVKIGKKWTYDASATPEFGDLANRPTALAKVDLEQIRSSMAEVVQRAEADDPKALRKRISELEAEIRTGSSERVKVVEKIVEKPVSRAEDLRKLEQLTERVEAAAKMASQASQELVAIAPLLERHVVQATAPLAGASGAPLQSLPRTTPEAEKYRKPALYQRHPNVNKKTIVAKNGLSKCARGLLDALAQRSPLTRPQLSALSGYSVKSGGFKNAISELHAHNPPLIVKLGDDLAIASPEVIEQVVHWQQPAKPRTVDELHALWRPKLSKCARTLFDLLCLGDPCTREDLSDQSGYSISSGGFKNAISELNSNRLIIKDGDDIRIVDELR
jgi:hypothetical protein